MSALTEVEWDALERALGGRLSANDPLAEAIERIKADAYQQGRADALRSAAENEAAIREASAEVGWDYGPEQAAWLRTLAHAMSEDGATMAPWAQHAFEPIHRESGCGRCGLPLQHSTHFRGVIEVVRGATMAEAERLSEGIIAIEAKWADECLGVAHDLLMLLRDPEWKPRPSPGTPS